MLVYCTGISHPANGTILAPSRMCSSQSGVFLCATSLTSQAKRRGDHAQRWIGLEARPLLRIRYGSEDDEIHRVENNAIHLARELRDITVRQQ